MGEMKRAMRIVRSTKSKPYSHNGMIFGELHVINKNQIINT